MLPEKELIQLCKKIVEQKFHLPQNGVWKQRDFEYLSDLIFKTTNTRISLSTLKRIWKDDNRMPQTYTLNALVSILEYQSWTDFKQTHSNQLKQENETSTEKKSMPFIPKRTYRLWIPAVLVVVALLIFYATFFWNKPFNESTIIFKSKKNLGSGVPNTVVFEYDISKIDFDSAFIQQSWDERMKARISKQNHFQTFIYYYPGYHTAKLIVDNKIVKREYVNITTNGWEALVDGGFADKLPQYLPEDSIISNGKLYVSKQTLLNNDITVDDKDFFINYFNVGNFKGAEGEDFSFETRIKNNLKEGALVCQYAQITLLCENGMLSIPFCNPGCASNIHLHISDRLLEGKKNDLSAFGLDLSDWKNIKIKTVKKQVSVSADDKNIFQLKYNKELGKITGVHFKFYGCGAVDMIKLYSAQNKLCYSNEF